MKVNKLLPYLAGGGAMWYFMLNSGVHPTVVGVLLAFAIPFGDGSEKSPSYILQHFLHKPVAFLILPLFAIANTCIPIAGNFLYGLSQRYTLGIIAGLVIGKPLGIWLFSFIAVSLGFCKLPDGLNWKRITGAGFLGGIGFTMSIFITLLSFEDAYIVNTSKIAILMASVIAGITGYIWLRRSLREA
jgi:NhaA family Na+:H+ antiporter